MKAASSKSASALVDASDSATCCAGVSSVSAVVSDPHYCQTQLQEMFLHFVYNGCLLWVADVCVPFSLGFGKILHLSIQLEVQSEVLDTAGAVWLTLGEGLLDAPKEGI